MIPSPPHFGRYETLLLRDGVFEAPSDAIAHADGEAARQRAIERFGKPAIRLDVNCFVLRNADGITLVDTGAGASWGPAFGLSRTALAAAGIAPEQVDRVLLTHLHEDHALGLFEGEAAYFPRAEIWVPQTDLAFFSDPEARERLPEARRGGFVMAERVGQVYGERMRAIPDGVVMEGIEAVPLPGHTPGHTGYLVHDPDGSLLIWGDLLHIESLQPGEPEIGLMFDSDLHLAARTRRATLDRAAREGWFVAGGHIGGFARVERTTEAFRLVPAQATA